MRVVILYTHIFLILIIEIHQDEFSFFIQHTKKILKSLTRTSFFCTFAKFFERNHHNVLIISSL